MVSPNDNNATGNDDEKPKDLPLASGIPPWHSLALSALVLSVCIPILPSFEEMDAMSEPSVWSHRKFPDMLSLRGLAFARLGIAAIALSLTFYQAVIADGWDVFANYKPGSKLRRLSIRLKGFGTLCPFTSWSWMILGFGFLSRGILALAEALREEAAASGEAPPEWTSSLFASKPFLRVTLVLGELTGPLAMLVSTVTKYAIWPEAIKGGRPHNLAGFRNQLQHNFNTVFSLTEATFGGGVPIKFTHLSMAALMGAVYMLFTWTSAIFYFGNKEIGPQYLYWFMDTTLGKRSTIFIVVLLSMMSIFFGIYSLLVGTVLGGGETTPTLLPNLIFLITGTKLLCRFKE